MNRWRTENDFFNRNIVELIEKNRWKFIVIKGEQFIEVYDSPITAYKETVKHHHPLTFLVLGCQPIYPVEPGTLAPVSGPKLNTD